MDSKTVLDIFKKATLANYDNSFRVGNIIKLEGPGRVIVSGDVHGHIRNFEKLVAAAQMDKSSDNHLVVHELIHCNEPISGLMCHSHKLLIKAAELKLRYPNQLHILMGNHEMAQITQDEVLKNGQPMVRSFNAGVQDVFGEHAGDIGNAILAFLMSLPLVCRTDNRIWISHSLPAIRNLASFDSSVFDEPITLNMLRNSKSLRALIWDRRQCASCVEQLKRMWDIDVFVVGHQAQASGCCNAQNGMIILASDHNHGCHLEFDLDRAYRAEELYRLVKPLSVVV